MKLGIMQPYFFPYFGYFDHIFLCDTWVVLDITQYTPQSWMNRNRVLHPEKPWQYVTLFVKKTSEKQTIADVCVCSLNNSKKEILKKLFHYKKHAPYFSNVMDIIEQSFDMAASDALTNINVSALTVVCRYLSIPFNPIIASEAAFPLPEITHAGQWALEICTQLGADIYLNTPGGRAIFRPEEFAARGIRLAFTGVPSCSYSCQPYEYEPSLSILDVLMWNSPETVRAHLGKTAVSWAD